MVLPPSLYYGRKTVTGVAYLFADNNYKLRNKTQNCLKVVVWREYDLWEKVNMIGEIHIHSALFLEVRFYFQDVSEVRLKQKVVT